MNILRIHQFNDILLESAFGILVVFAALTLLVIAFTLVARIVRISAMSNLKKSAREDGQIIRSSEISGEEMAAISMALHIILSDEHDEESNVITIKKIERRYSPWSSKIYGMRNL